MVARQFVVRQGPAAGGSCKGEAEAEEHEVEYDTDHGIDVHRFQIFSLTSVPPDLQKIMVEVDGSVVDDGTDLESLSERLRVVAIGEDDGEDAAAADAAVEAARAQEKSDEELARMLQAEEEALLLQQYSVRNDGGEVFRQRVEPYMNWVLMYEDPVRQEAARKTVPIHELEEKALVSLAKILDFTDHVWTECFSNLYGRWMHLDPCEGVYDNPLPYEKGWNKKLDYVIAISKDGVRDVTKRYTRKLREVLSRRTITSEETISAVLSSITRKYRTGLSTGALSVIENRDKEESEELSKAAYLEVETTLSLPGRLSGSVEWRKARVLEGSADGGSSWNTIDTRSSEMFETRFFRKTFTVDKRCKANAFRFRFLCVRESHSNPRFQIGSIDLYGRTM
ncbi:hypothetical protein C2845_PM04G25180 [Panicum miliaceum]|uniref:Rad4/PNGase transglutaminase-like fold domain-containing protein n=1 Tax=Panicum miliaceum TaxID=4540 RepID=A0A3L6QQ63_PANMI|nr:hypothetical protein C2845_PM04G25180 [Panicum miliaceum]